MSRAGVEDEPAELASVDPRSDVFAIGVLSEAPQPVVVNHRLRNVPEAATWAWEPGAHFGIYRPDEFWFDPEANVTQ